MSHIAGFLQTGHLTSGEKPSQFLISPPNKDVLGLCLPAESHLDGLRVTLGSGLLYGPQLLSNSLVVLSTSSDSLAQRLLGGSALQDTPAMSADGLVVTREGAAGI